MYARHLEYAWHVVRACICFCLAITPPPLIKNKDESKTKDFEIGFIDKFGS